MTLTPVSLLTIFSLLSALPVLAEEHKSHAPKSKEEHHDHKDGDENHHDEGKEEKHEHHGEKEKEHGHGGHEEEGGSAVGADKGITESGPLGLKFSPEALKTILPKSIPFAGGSITIPYAALLRVKDAKSVYRVRNGWYKSVPASVESRNGGSVVVRSSELSTGDQVVVQNIGFLRMAEVISVEGASHSHSH